MRENLLPKAFPHAHRKLVQRQANERMAKVEMTDEMNDTEPEITIPIPTPPPQARPLEPSRRIDPGLRALLDLKKRTGVRRSSIS